MRIAIMAVLILTPVPAFAWGAEGHEVIAAIALRAMTPAARAQTARLLGGEAMLIHDASWADEIREQRPDTGPWHYVDIPLEAGGYVAARDCRKGDCVVAQIDNDVRDLSSRRLPDAARAEALRFLLHFVADIHQPLHAVDHDDRGGNAVRVTIGRLRTNLHHVWDVEVVQALGWDTAQVADDVVARITPAQRKAWQAGTSAAWADESHAIARDEIYPLTDGRRSLRLSPGYLRAETGVTRTQLARAGTRLAWLLNNALR